MAIMVFKRSVYETRRKPKALLRPKTRANLKEAAHVSPQSVQSTPHPSLSPPQLIPHLVFYVVELLLRPNNV